MKTTKTEALAAPVQEPVAAECKFDREPRWVRCEIAHHSLVQSEPQNWMGYQTRLLYTTPPTAQPAVPDGWKLVPVEPTDEMLDAAQSRVDDIYRLDAMKAYEAMIAAAPMKGGAA